MPSASERLRKTVPEGYIHPQYLPTVWGILRSATRMTMDRKVRREVSEYLHEPGEDGGKTLDDMLKEKNVTDKDDRFFYAFMAYSNNFYALLDFPGSNQEGFMEMDPSLLDQPLGPEIRAARMRAKKSPGIYHEHPRSVMERRTTRQFYEDVNRASERAGLDRAALAKTVKDERSLRRTIKLGRLIFPTYVRLRELGYSSEDLF
jgi:hypothetical protein